MSPETRSRKEILEAADALLEEAKAQRELNRERGAQVPYEYQQGRSTESTFVNLIGTILALAFVAAVLGGAYYFLNCTHLFGFTIC